MSGRREFDIAFVGLKPGVHQYNYEIDEKFFASYPSQDFSNTHAKVRMQLEKKHKFHVIEI
jgi:hypothetical protein